MKKMIMMALAVCGMTVMAAEYQVYDLVMNVKTTTAKGKVTTSCSGEYVWRDGKTHKIQGIIAGCGCGAILADGSCENALVLLWDATTKTQISNEVITAWTVQRIGKKGEKCEHMASFACDDFEVTLAGLGTYKPPYLKRLSGNFAGFAKAPWLITAGSCTACSVTPGSEDQTMAAALCEDDLCTTADNSDFTPMYGTYTIKYNASKSKKVSKSGISAKALGCPAYVVVDEGFFD